jgi:glyoxylase-like metal-dependent hydrolase (beta-lactamase superfamily II)
MKLLALAALLIARTVISPGVVLFPGQLSPDRSPDGNSVLLHGPEGWVVIDTGRGGDHTDELLRFFSAAGAGPRAVLNTHWHLDHIGGNADFRREWPRATILAHPALDGALAGFHAANRDQLEKLVPTLTEKPELQARLETELALLKLDRQLAANEPVVTSGTRSFAGRALDLHVETRAVSNGDIWILDRESKTLLSGDLVTLPVPLFDTACPEGWQQALSRLAEAEFETLVPGHGEPMTRASFSTYRRGFDALLACAGSSAGNAACIEGWFRDVRAADSPYARELLDYYLKQFLRPDAPGRKRWCEG